MQCPAGWKRLQVTIAFVLACAVCGMIAALLVWCSGAPSVGVTSATPTRNIQASGTIWRAQRLGGGLIGITSEASLQVWRQTQSATGAVFLSQVDFGTGVQESNAWVLSANTIAWTRIVDEAVVLEVRSMVDTKPLWSRRLPCRWDRIWCVAVHPGKALVAFIEHSYDSGSYDIAVVDGVSGKIVLDVPAKQLGGNEHVGELTFSPDGTLLAFAGTAGNPALGVISTTSKIMLWHRQCPNLPYAISFGHDGMSFYVTDNCGGLSRYESRSGKLLWRVQVPKVGSTAWGDSAMERMLAVDTSPDGRYVAAAIGYGRQIGVWDATSGKCVRLLRTSTNPVHVLVFDADSAGIWFSGAQDTRVWYIPIG